MAFEGEVNEVKQIPNFPEKTAVDYVDTWTMDKVARWLETNDFKSSIEVFKGLYIFIHLFFPFFYNCLNTHLTLLLFLYSYWLSFIYFLVPIFSSFSLFITIN